MKTKLIILTAIAAIILHSCSSDRDEDARKAAIEKVKASTPELKLNQKELAGKNIEDSVLKDTIIIKNSNILEAEVSTVPEDGGDPKDVPIPPRR